MTPTEAFAWGVFIGWAVACPVCIFMLALVMGGHRGDLPPHH